MFLAGERSYIDLAPMVRATMAPFMGDDNNRVVIDGPDLRLSEPTGGALALALHELATNAIKYGALSVPDGKVAIRWKTTPAQNGEAFNFEWMEKGGPHPTPPEKPGFGMRVIESAPLREKSGDVAVEYRPEGLYCRISFVTNRMAA
jgi:two-component sensor histidine kinase